MEPIENEKISYDEFHRRSDALRAEIEKLAKTINVDLNDTPPRLVDQLRAADKAARI